jgi:hypothetical protein
MRKAVAFSLLLAFTIPLFAGLDSKKSSYVGGTVASIPKDAEGIMSTDDTKTLSFKSEKATWLVPYEKVTSLSYGQHAGRRVGATVALGVTTLGIGALPMLFSKKRRHYLTVEYSDEQGAAQAAIFEVGKDAIRTTLKSLEVRTGKKVDFEDDEARKAGNK